MKKNKYEMKYNVRKIKNTLDRYRMFSMLSMFYKQNKVQLTTKQLHVLGILLFYAKIKKVCIKDLIKKKMGMRFISLYLKGD